MTCSHLKELYRVCQTNGLRMSSAELIHIVCPECGVKEVCPSVYSIEYDAIDEATPESPAAAKPSSEQVPSSPK
ncbi:MAG: hypothetical protein R3C10_09480 [Pirellulales bacterium]|nr:hypothetical protein [Planctomycetales bacterium]